MKKVLHTTTLVLLSFACFGQNLQPGLIGEYFHIGGSVREFPELEVGQKPTIKRIDAKIDFPAGHAFADVSFTNDFFVRWTGKIHIDTAGIYKFFLESDDGSEFYIYDRKVVENGDVHGMKETSGQVELPPGDHTVHLNYFQGSRTLGCKLSWSSDKIEKQIVPATVLFHEPLKTPAPPAAGPGLIAEFFDMRWTLWHMPKLEVYETPTVSRIDAVVAFPDIESFSLPGFTNHFYGRWTGKLAVPKTGTYTFSLSSDDGSQLLIDGKRIVDHTSRHTMTGEKSGTIDLAEGSHDFKLEYFQNEGYAGCALWWAGPELAKDIVPKTAFSH